MRIKYNFFTTDVRWNEDYFITQYWYVRTVKEVYKYIKVTKSDLGYTPLKQYKIHQKKKIKPDYKYQKDLYKKKTKN